MTDPHRMLILLINRLGGRAADDVEACVELLGRLAHASEGLTMHEVGLVMDEVGSAAVDEDIWDLLVDSGLCAESRGRIALASTDIGGAGDIAALLAPIETVPQLPTTAADLGRCITRVSEWAASLLEIAAEDDLPGLPVFWQRDGGESVPLGRNVGSMATVDTIDCVIEPLRYGWPRHAPLPSEIVRRMWEQILSIATDLPGDWYDGAVDFQEFDDDFVGSFLPQQASLGSCPTTEATANRVFGLVCLVRAVGEDHPDLVDRSRSAIAAGVRCLLRWQEPSGAWAIHRYPADAAHKLAPRDVSCQYAADALMEAIAEDLVPQDLIPDVLEALRQLASYLVATAEVTSDGTSWLGDFVVAGLDPQLRTTTLVGLIIGRLADVLEDQRLVELQIGLVEFLRSRWNPAPDQVFTSEFRSPTWDGPALAPFTWEMVRDAFIVTALLDYDARRCILDASLASKVQLAVDGILRSEFRGSWLDIPMASEGKVRAFVSNSLHSLRAVIAAAAWCTRSIPAGLHMP